MSGRGLSVARDTALWGAAGALVLGAHLGVALWLAQRAEAAAPPGEPEAVFIDLAPAPEPTEAPATQQTVAELQPEDQQPEPDPIPEPEVKPEPPSLPDLTPPDPEPQMQEETPPEVVSSPELTLSSSTRPHQRPRHTPKPRRAEPRREPEPEPQRQAQPAPQPQPAAPAPQKATRGAAGQGASGISPQAEASLIQQWGGRIGACIQRRARLPRHIRSAGLVTLSLVVSRNGTVQVQGIAGSSGNPEVDQVALQAAQRAGRCPAAPAGLDKPSYQFNLPVNLTK